MKKSILIIGVVVFFSLAPHVFAQGFVPLAPIPGLTQGATADPTGLANFFNNLYKFLIGISAVLAVIMIIWGGLEYSTQDSVSKKSDGKERIYQAIFGLILVLSPVLVFSIINPSILNLSINLPPLDTAVRQAPSPGTASSVTSITPQSGTTFIPCGSDLSCKSAAAKCNSVGVQKIVCLKSDGSVDPDGMNSTIRTILSHGFGSYSCISGETLSVQC